VDGVIAPFDRTKCWTAKDWLDFMMRDRWDDACACIKPGSAQFTPGDPKEDGDASGTHPGFWLNHDPSGRLVGVVHKKTATNANGVLVVDYPRAEERIVPGPVATPCPSPSPSPSVPPNPGGGLKCAPLDSVGVAFHAQHPAPNGPLGYRWVFSATPKSAKPFCPEHRNECEQQAYIGDPVANYDAVVWRFDERFKCQDPAGPLWNQQEPHTGQSWEPTDVRQENNYLANLKPAVKGKHVVRTCRRDAPTVCRYAEKVAN
jgi:hypothetical protein